MILWFLTQKKLEHNVGLACSEYTPFMSQRSISLVTEVKFYEHKINISRDTGVAQSLVVADILPLAAIVKPSEKTVLLQGIEGGFVSVPLLPINLKSNLGKGHVTAGVTQTLPMKGVDFLLGNDLAGGKVMPYPHMTRSPAVEEKTDNLEEEFPGIFPACVITRARS